jgi:predicted nucleotidyltransferase
MTRESVYLLSMARRLGESFAGLSGVRAVMVTGSVALGESDGYSDIDMTAYYTELPPEEDLHAVRVTHKGSERLWVLGDRDEGGFAESYIVDGVHVQIGHVTLDVWEQQMDVVLEQFDPATPLHKALSGTLDCLPLHGADLIDQWKERIARYPDGLARAVVEKHLAFFPLWYLEHYLEPRDAVLWTYQSLVEAAQNILGVLAGLNRVYYTTFQFKRMRKFVASLHCAPDRLAERLEKLFAGNIPVAIATLEELVRDTVALVETHMPEIDTTKATRRLGERQRKWMPVQMQ